MPLDIALSTNTPTATIELRQAQRWGESRHVAAFVLVRSGAFAAALPFIFALEELVSFATALEELAHARTGLAALHGKENDDVIRFVATEVGELRVGGELHEPSDAQVLTFGFVADWQGLTTFLDGVRQLRATLET